MIVMIFKVQFFCFLALLVCNVYSLPYDPDRPRNQHITFTPQQERLMALAGKYARVNVLLEESKTPRPRSPRRKHVAEKDRAKYDLHREGEHKFEKTGEIANYILNEKPIKNYKKKKNIQKQKFERNQAEYVREVAAIGKERHAKAANALLPLHLRYKA